MNKVSKNIWLLVVVIIVITFVLLINLRTGKNSDTSPEQSGQANMSEDTPVDLGNKLPENFSDDIPVFPGSVLKSSSTTDDGFSLAWESDESVSSVFEFYKQNLQDLGWGISDVLESGSFYTLSFSKEGRFGILAVTEGEEGKTVISVTIGSRNN